MVAVDTTALVVEAGYPLTNPSRFRMDKVPVVILCDQLTPPIYVEAGLRLGTDHWLVRGQRIPVSIDPAKPQKFEIDWSGVPGIEQRAAANDPTLADPRGTKEAVWATVRQSGAWGPGAASAQAADREDTAPDRLAEALQRA